MKKPRTSNRTHGSTIRQKPVATAMTVAAMAGGLLLGHPSSVSAAARTIEQRVVLVREAIARRLSSKEPVSPASAPDLPYAAVEVAQWGNWGNWGNWNNWNNWRDWNNWGNWGNAWSSWGNY